MQCVNQICFCKIEMVMIIIIITKTKLLTSRKTYIYYEVIGKINTYRSASLLGFFQFSGRK